VLTDAEETKKSECKKRGSRSTTLAKARKETKREGKNSYQGSSEIGTAFLIILDHHRHLPFSLCVLVAAPVHLPLLFCPPAQAPVHLPFSKNRFFPVKNAIF
jgi:hypothetical protein